MYYTGISYCTDSDKNMALASKNWHPNYKKMEKKWILADGNAGVVVVSMARYYPNILMI